MRKLSGQVGEDKIVETERDGFRKTQRIGAERPHQFDDMCRQYRSLNRAFRRLTGRQGLVPGLIPRQAPTGTGIHLEQGG